MSKRIENGEPAYLAGKSGIEIVNQVLEETMGQTGMTEAVARYERSCEYWIGWAVAYYQWYSGRRFREIFQAISFEDFQKMYYTPTKLISANLRILQMQEFESIFRKRI